MVEGGRQSLDGLSGARLSARHDELGRTYNASIRSRSGCI
jgi:hypothetical protein